jgi:lipopolysaccharide exporter
VNLLGQLGRGVAWTYTGMVISGVLQVFVVAATARLLPPEAFGLIAMVNVVLRFGSYFAQMGVGRALIQRASIDDDDVRAAFTSSTLFGALTTVTVIAIAPLAAAYFQTGDVVAVMRWLALTFFISGLGATARALLQRRLKFRAVSTIEVVSYAFGYAVPTLVLAASGYGVWSLVAGALGQVTVSTGATMLFARHRLAPVLRWAPHARLLRFGATVSGISVVEFIGSSLDTLVIGRFGTATQLGIYNRAFMLASLPTYQLHHGIAKVLFPVLSGGRSTRLEFANTIVVASQTSARIVMPLGIGMGLTAPELVEVALGPSWVDAVPLFAVLAPALALNLMWAIPAQALEALGHLRWKAAIHACYAILLGLALTLSARHSLDLRTATAILAAAILLRTLAMHALAFRLGVVPLSYPGAMLGTVLVSAAASAIGFLVVLVPLRGAGASSLMTVGVAAATGATILASLFAQPLFRMGRRRLRRRS